MIKKVAAVVILLLIGGGWFYMDYTEKQNQLAAEEARKAVLLARAKAEAIALAIAEAKAKFEAAILADLNNCKAAAEKTKSDYVTLNHKPVRRKPGEFTIPPAVAEEADKMLAAANAECQLSYDTRQKNGS